ncbi:MAG: cysteine synthase family protein [Gammaproteobacteria bacterium]|nr:cysteine synthase family protein [Gammaproteobacteria bacterium]NIR83168.1 cysteine synthase family protein [Gammaproteobacteria bacterium]NIR90976.1 cysteine synthase family protein [Gammaproteobacteria bacterium]NIU04333.1 cysteine synthase family protein [Gammaproteobacteria bacterium]NIV52556.1 pyridoxal-phosphate dependent enzyme [Gammaproteobacteria bacterium]
MSDPACRQRVRGLRSLVGNTPLLAIDYTLRGREGTVYVKAENMNMTGSIKDRMALHILALGYDKSALRPGDLIVEASSGNTGISFAAVGRALGHPVAIFMPDWMSTERMRLIRSFGAELHLVSADQGGFLGAIERAEALARASGRSFLPRQFANEDNVDAHARTTGPEIWWQLESRSLVPDAFVAGVGTGGTLMGVGRFLRGRRPGVKLYPVEPASSPTLSTGCRVGEHRIQGISDEFVPPIVDLDIVDAVIDVDDGDAILMAQKLAADLGLGVGISSGANFVAAAKVHASLGRDAVVVTVFPDCNKKYLSTDLLHEEPPREGFVTPDMELVAFRSFRRVCRTCFELDDAQSWTSG